MGPLVSADCVTQLAFCLKRNLIPENQLTGTPLREKERFFSTKWRV